MTLLGSVVAALPVWRTDIHLNVQALVVTLLLMVVAAAAVALAARGVRTRDAGARVPAALSIAAERGLGFDYAYRLVVATPVVALAEALTWFDREVLDAWVRAGGVGTRLLGRTAQWLTPAAPPRPWPSCWAPSSSWPPWGGHAMTDRLTDLARATAALVPDLGTAWLALALAPLLLVAVTLLVAGRWPTAPATRRSGAGRHGDVGLGARCRRCRAAPTGARAPWIPGLGVWLRLQADGLSIPLLLLTAVVSVVATLLHLHVPPPARHTPVSDEDVAVTSPIPDVRSLDVPGLATYHACLLLVTLGALVAFLAGDAILFFVGFGGARADVGAGRPLRRPRQRP